MYLAAILFFFIPGRDRGHVATLLTLKAKWFATITKNNGNNDEQCCVNVFPDRLKGTLQAGRVSYGHTVQSVAARSIVHKFLKHSWHGQSLKEYNGFIVSFTTSFDQ